MIFSPIFVFQIWYSDYVILYKNRPIFFNPKAYAYCCQEKTHQNMSDWKVQSADSAPTAQLC